MAVLAVGVVVALAAGSPAQALWLVSTAPLWIVAAKLYGLYDRDQASLRHLTTDEAPTLFSWALTCSVTASLFVRVTPGGPLSTTAAIEVFLTAFVAAHVFRSGARLVWRRVTPPERTLIIGDGSLAQATRRKLELFSDIHAELVSERESLTPLDLKEEGPWLAEIDRVVVASQSIDETLIRELIGLCRQEKVKLSVVPPARAMFGTAVRLNHVAELPIVEYHTWDVARSTIMIKRIMDVIGASVALVLVAPFLLLLSLAIFADSRGPIIFAQTRAGLDGRPFRMFKFRTMVRDAEARLEELLPLDRLQDPMFKIVSDPRVTRVGRLLRRTSLDEVPQLFNVLRGEMSLVGPRPEQVELVERYGSDHLFRLTVKPGLTGPMQVYGRGHLGFEERLAVEREYVENVSLARDLRILALTVSAVITGRGAV